MKKKLLIILPLALLVIAGLAFALEKTGVTNFYQSDSEEELTTEETLQEQKIDYSPATPTDNEDINKQKEDGFTPPPTTQPAETAIVTITRANANNNVIQINALISGLSDGTCTATLTQGSTVITATAPVSTQESYIYCDAFTFNSAQVTDGKWQVTVTATSADGKITGTGTSELDI